MYILAVVGMASMLMPRGRVALASFPSLGPPEGTSDGTLALSSAYIHLPTLSRSVEERNDDQHH